MEENIYPLHMQNYIRRFRNKTADFDPLLNILNEQKLEFSDEQVAGYIEESWYMINEKEPRTSYPLERFPRTALLLDGAMMMMLEAKGILELRNQISYNDAGLSVNLHDKSGHYAQWLAQKATLFLQDLTQFKRAQVPRFRGVGSPMRWW